MISLVSITILYFFILLMGPQACFQANPFWTSGWLVYKWIILFVPMSPGVIGQVTDQSDKPISGLQVRIEGRQNVIPVSESGHFYKLLKEGSHMITISAPGETV